ncbi:hypothetical protein P4O66_001518 [Electrophorus voltai]|uniref:Uncharacterized protein n=1 Tax=Electrophorus voltai TaxID=2609070 RepID=A0AAD9DV09_9TELE|nr:hypothetical protein P4O66_001518 [Electrophorus voltai]
MVEQGCVCVCGYLCGLSSLLTVCLLELIGCDQLVLVWPVDGICVCGCVEARVGRSVGGSLELRETAAARQARIREVLGQQGGGRGAFRRRCRPAEVGVGLNVHGERVSE